MTEKRRLQITAAPLPMVCAIGIVIANMLPAQLLSMHYDPSMVEYWISHGIPVAVVAILVGVLPIPFFEELPARCRAILLRPSGLQFAQFLLVAVLTLTLVLQMIALDQYPSTADEIAQLFHAKVIAGGALSMPVDPNPEFLAIDNIVDSGRWYSQYPIGGVLALVPGVLIGMPWLVNPILGALCVAGTYLFARKAFGEVQGRCVALVLAQSQNMLFMSATYLNHLPTLFCAVLMLIGLAEWEGASDSRSRHRFAALVGFSIGLMATIRQLDALAATLAVGLFQLYVIRGDFRRYTEFAVQSLAGLAGSLPVFLANWATTGSPLRFGYDVAWGTGHRIGFHVDPHGQVHDFVRGVGYAARYMSQLNYATLGWPIPIALIVILGLVSMRKTSRWDALMIALIGGQLIAYALYWGLGDFFGPRFLFTVIPAIVIMVTRAPFLLGEMLGPRAQRAGLALFLLCFVVAWTSPHNGSIRGFTRQLPGVRRAFRLDFEGSVQAAGIHNAVVFIREATSARILHRIWGIGMPREEAAQFLDKHDACSMIAGVRAAERDSTATKEQRIAILRRMAVDLPTDQPTQLGTRDKGIKFASIETITNACREELDADDSTPGVYGGALLLNQFDESGKLSGDVIYLQDLSDHNEVLRRRFADRKWYRFVVSEQHDYSLTTKLIPY